MKLYICLNLYLSVQFVLSSQNRIPEKYKSNPFLNQLEKSSTYQRMPRRYENNPFLTQLHYSSSNQQYSNNPFLNPSTISPQSLASKYAHNPFLSPLFNKSQIPKEQRKPVLQTASELQTGVRNHKNFYLLPSRDACGVEGISDRISNGHEARIGQFPWMVLLEYRNRERSIGYRCGGMLINDRYILTAAHCVRGKTFSPGENLFRVRLGEHDLNTNPDCDIQNGCNNTPEDIEVEEFVLHDKYSINDKNYYNDIALLRLRNKTQITDFIKPVCLPLDGERSKPGVHLHISGWGARGDDVSSYVKIVADIPYIRDSQCQKLWKTKIDITDNQFCAGGMSKINVCRGDSGGPIMNTFPQSEHWYVEGIVSFGRAQCGGDPFPTVYTRVSSYINWILDNLKE